MKTLSKIFSPRLCQKVRMTGIRKLLQGTTSTLKDITPKMTHINGTPDLFSLYIYIINSKFICICHPCSFM